MSAHSTTTPADRRRTAETLAASIREGVEAREWLFEPARTPYPPYALDATVHMPPVAILADAPLPADEAGWRGRLRRFARVRLRPLLRPWADHQTAFNRLTIHLLHHQGVFLADRADTAADRLQARVEELTRLYYEANRKLDELAADRPAAGRP